MLLHIRHDLNTRPTTSQADRELMRYLRKVAFKAAKKFNLKLKEVDFFPVDHPDTARAEGVCEVFAQRIYLNLYNPLTGSYHSVESLIDTALHEVAHLKYKRDGHTPRFWIFLDVLREWYFEQNKR